jgi:hypothetical protein
MIVSTTSKSNGPGLVFPPIGHATGGTPGTGAWAARAAKLADWAWSRLVNRTDVWGTYTPPEERGQVYRGADGKEKKVPGSWTAPARSQRGRVSLTLERLRRHFAATAPRDVIGLHTTSPQNTSRWGAAEVDWHGPSSTAPEVNWRAALAWYGELRRLGFRPLLTDSNGKGGYHLRFLLREPVPTPQVFNFLRWLTRDHATLDLPNRPETFPKQRQIPEAKCGNWLRVPGRHHTREHWSRVWDGAHWLGGAEAIEFLLALDGDSPSLIPAAAAAEQAPQRPPPRRPWTHTGTPGNLSARIAAYMGSLPNLGEGQGRDDVGYQFAAFLVRDLALSDETAREWLSLWDGGNRPPKGAAEISKWLASARAYGQRPIGCGLAPAEAPEVPTVTPGRRPGHSTLRCRVEVY